MAKGTGLIGNFKGKVGNTVGYKLSSSNNGQTQGIRVYQPIVKNPKTAAQAEQRAKLLAVNGTYRALKMVIDRGNEGLPYGNKSRLAWLKTALKAETMPWFEKGYTPNAPVGCLITKGSLPSLAYTPNIDYVNVDATGVTTSTQVATIGALSTALKSAYPGLKEGDQLTFVIVPTSERTLMSEVISFIIDSTSSVAVNTLFSAVTVAEGAIHFVGKLESDACVVIVSRQGDNGEHLRSTEFLKIEDGVTSVEPYNTASKEAAIASYQSSAATNSDWAEESIQ